MSLTAARELVVKRMRHFGELSLRYQVMGDSSQLLDRAVIEEIPHPFTRAESPQLFLQADVIGELLLRLVPLRISMRTVDRPLSLGVCLCLIHQIRNPGRNRFDEHLRALSLQKIEHVEIAVALGDLSPKLARDFY